MNPINGPAARAALLMAKAESNFSSLLGTKIKILTERCDAGQVTINFNEINRLINAIKTLDLPAMRNATLFTPEEICGFCRQIPALHDLDMADEVGMLVREALGGHAIPSIFCGVSS